MRARAGNFRLLPGVCPARLNCEPVEKIVTDSIELQRLHRGRARRCRALLHGGSGRRPDALGLTTIAAWLGAEGQGLSGRLVWDQSLGYDAILELPDRFRRERSKHVPGCSSLLHS